MPGSPAREVVERSVAEQSKFLTPVLAGSSGVCPKCFGAVPSIPVLRIGAEEKWLTWLHP
ncbi:hypothetical protein GCM10009603_05760 [Nocardiopsis exhalans]